MYFIIFSKYLLFNLFYLKKVMNGYLKICWICFKKVVSK